MMLFNGINRTVSSCQLHKFPILSRPGRPVIPVVPLKTANPVSLADGKAHLDHNPGFTFTPLYLRMWLTLYVSSPVYGPVQNVFSLHSAFNIPEFHLNETEISGN